MADSDADRLAEQWEMARDFVTEMNEQRRLAEAKAEKQRLAREKRKACSKINKDDPLILKFDKWFDKFMTY